MGDQLVKEHKQLRQTWNESQTWPGYFCQGSYSYAVNVGTDLDNVKVDLKDEGYLQITANIKNLFAGVQGAYRSKATLCLPQGGWLGVGSSWGEMVTQVHFGEEGLEGLTIKIVSTKIGELKLGRYVPKWFEDFTGGLVNRALSAVWNSRLGEWLNAKITDEVRKKIPKSEL
ncbi:hypothetical protein K2X33_07995 [bacterium]|nr:hypothetical protein [bacterium]